MAEGSRPLHNLCMIDVCCSSLCVEPPTASTGTNLTLKPATQWLVSLQVQSVVNEVLLKLDTSEWLMSFYFNTINKQSNIHHICFTVYMNRV